MGVRLLVTGGWFDDVGDGVVHHVDLDSGRVDTFVRWMPPERFRVPGKGFAGACLADGSLLVAAHAAVVRIPLATATVDGVLHQPDFNDLHHVATDGAFLYVANTGSDAVETFTPDGVWMERTTWLPGWVQARRLAGEDPADLYDVCRTGWTGEPHAWTDRVDGDGYHSDPVARRTLPFHRAKVPDRVHPNHVLPTADGLLVTCLYDGTLRRPGCATPVAHVDGFPHDGVASPEGIWFTTIDGGVHVVEPGRRPRRVLDVFETGHLGWCRGLAHTDDLILVGLTEVKRNRLPRHRWADADPDRSETSVLALDRRDGRLLARVDLTDRTRHHKIYSLLVLP